MVPDVSRLCGLSHPGEHNGTTIRVGQDDETPPGSLLRGPENTKPTLPCLPLAAIRIFRCEAHGRAANPLTSREDPSLVVALVISMEHHASGEPTDHDDDLIFEQQRQPKCVDIERARCCQVADEEDQALETVYQHDSNLQMSTRCRGRESGWLTESSERVTLTSGGE